MEGPSTHIVISRACLRMASYWATVGSRQAAVSRAARTKNASYEINPASWIVDTNNNKEDTTHQMKQTPIDSRGSTQQAEIMYEAYWTCIGTFFGTRTPSGGGGGGDVGNDQSAALVSAPTRDIGQIPRA